MTTSCDFPHSEGARSVIVACTRQGLHLSLSPGTAGTRAEMSGWVAPSAVAVTCYGTWAFLSKVALNQGLHPDYSMPVEKAGLALVVALAMKAGGDSGGAAAAPGLMQQPKLALLSAFMSGVIGTSGGLFYSKAMAVGDASTVAAVTASYPPVTLLLGVIFLKEKLDANKIIGMVLALLSALFFARAGKAAS